MKRYTILLLTLISLTVLGDPFRNFNFEQANTNSLGFDVLNNTLVGLVMDLLPGWQLFEGTNQLTSIAYNGSSAFGDNGGGPLLIGLGPSTIPLEGRYSFYINASAGGPEPRTLVQRGDIPANARFLSLNYRGEEPLVIIDGVTLMSPMPVAGFPNPISLDISQFAGRNVELRLGTPGFAIGTAYGIDDIRFIPDIPEPSTWALFASGGLLLLSPSARRRLSR